jgi:hypothetical protein
MAGCAIELLTLDGGPSRFGAEVNGAVPVEAGKMSRITTTTAQRRPD